MCEEVSGYFLPWSIGYVFGQQGLYFLKGLVSSKNGMMFDIVIDVYINSRPVDMTSS